MPSTTPLTDAINALTRYANETTGASDTTLSDAVGTLVAGYGGGGGWTTDGIATNSEPNGVITLGSSVTLLDAYALAGAPITRCIAPYVRNARQYAFINAFASTGRIENTDFPLLANVTGVFEQCNFVYVNMPAVTGNIAYAFRNCPNLVEIHLPNTAYNIDRTCLGCRKLEIADLGKGSISNGASFQNCTALRTLVLRNTDQVQALSAWSANCMGGIYNNPTESTIYVPSALISSYQTASNWSSAYAAGVTFAAIEGSQYE